LDLATDEQATLLSALFDADQPGVFRIGLEECRPGRSWAA
jgi:hypothetical protein